MTATSLTVRFAVALVAWLATQLWLATRQMGHVTRHREDVPAPFAATVTLQAHRKAADYTLAKGRFGLLQAALGTAVVVGWTLLGGLDALNAILLERVHAPFGAPAYQLARARFSKWTIANPHDKEQPSHWHRFEWLRTSGALLRIQSRLYR